MKKHYEIIWIILLIQLMLFLIITMNTMKEMNFLYYNFTSDSQSG